MYVRGRSTGQKVKRLPGNRDFVGFWSPFFERWAWATAGQILPSPVAASAHRDRTEEITFYVIRIQVFVLWFWRTINFLGNLRISQLLDVCVKQIIIFLPLQSKSKSNFIVLQNFLFMRTYHNRFWAFEAFKNYVRKLLHWIWTKFAFFTCFIHDKH